MSKKTKNKLPYLLLPVIILIAAYPLLKTGFYTFHDETQIANLYQFIKTINLGQFPPRWGTDFHFEYGSPFPEFYYQLPYYLAYFLSFLLNDLTVIFKAIIIISISLSVIGMYSLSRKFIKPLPSLAVATLYTLSPYQALNIYVRGSLGETLALGLFPWVTLTLIRLKKPTKSKIIQASIMTGLLLLTHQLAIVLVLPFILFIIGGYFVSKKKFKALTSLFFSQLAAAGLTLFYWLPLLLEKTLIKDFSPFNFYDHFPFIKQLVYSPWGYGSSNWGPYDDLSFMLGFLNWGVVILAILLFIKYFKKVRKNPLLPLTFVSFVLTITLMNIRTRPLWEIFPFTQLIQFPWRLLMASTFLSSILLIFTFKYLPKKIISHLSIAIILLSVILNFNYFKPHTWVNNTQDYYLHRFLPRAVLYLNEDISPDYLLHAEDYLPLPKNATRPSVLPDAKLTASEEDTSILIMNNNPLNYQAVIKSPESGKATFHTFDFPGWNTYLGGELVAHSQDDLGAMVIDYPKGETTLNIKFQRSPIRKASEIGSVISLLALVYLLLRPSTLKLK